MSLKTFSPELLTRIFLQLSYKSLLRVGAVCVQWKAIVEKDPHLSVQVFKRLSNVYVEPGCKEPAFRSESRSSSRFSKDPVRLHPALNEVSYSMGDDLEDVTFYTGSNDGDYPKLYKLAIANDFISIPMVKTAKLTIRGAFQVKVKNAKGIKLVDVFTAMAKDSSAKFTTKRHGTMTRAETLGDHRFYEGLEMVIRTGLELSAELFLGS